MGSTLFIYLVKSMQEFNYLNLHTVYECSGEFSESTGNEGDYCFRRIFHNKEGLGNREITEKYVITTYKGIDYLVTSKKNNACIFSPEEIRKHLEIANSEIHPFTYQIEETRVHRGSKYYPAYKVTLEITGKFLYHKCILTWFRYLYEYPSNLIMKDAYRLKASCPSFRFVNMLDIYNLVSSCYPYDDYKSDQTLSWGGKFMTIKQFKNRLKELEPQGTKNGILSKIYGQRLNSRYSISSLPNCNNLHYDFAYWTGDEYFEERKALYLNEFKNRTRK